MVVAAGRGRYSVRMLRPPTLEAAQQALTAIQYVAPATNRTWTAEARLTASSLHARSVLLARGPRNTARFVSKSLPIVTTRAVLVVVGRKRYQTLSPPTH